MPSATKEGTDMAEVKRVERPLSPHLQIYRPQLTSITSILTRITGNALIVGVALAVWWLLAAAVSDEYFATANWVATTGLGIATAEKLGWACIIGSVVLAVATIVIV